MTDPVDNMLFDRLKNKYQIITVLNSDFLIKLISCFLPEKKWKKKAQYALSKFLWCHSIKFETKIYNLIIIDNFFPLPHANTWRSVEYHEYFRKIPNTICLNIPNGFINRYLQGLPEKVFREQFESYLRHNPENNEFIKRIDFHTKYQARLAYILFFATTSLMLPWLEKNKIPFVFTLYPGGGFAPDIYDRDRELKKIFSSPMFRRVIVTQHFTLDYLIRNKMCPKQKISFIFGSLSQYNEHDVLPKQFYPKDKKTFDLSFVAYKYTDKGIRKGFDTFIQVAKKLSRSYDDMHFHVVGNWEEEMKPYLHYSNIHFYSERPADFFPEFYSGIDIALSPNRSHQELKHKKFFSEDAPIEFDGFPLAADAGMSSVALFVTDELNHTKGFFNDGEDIVLINHNVSDICKKIAYYFKNTDHLYELSRKQTIKFKKLFNKETQINQRLKVLQKYISI